MAIPFDPTRSYVYRAARYELLPRIAEIARGFSKAQFLFLSYTLDRYTLAL